MESDEGTSFDNRQLFVTARQLAIMLRVSPRTLCEMRKAGRLPNPLAGAGAVRWRLDDALKCLSEFGAFDETSKRTRLKARGDG